MGVQMQVRCGWVGKMAVPDADGIRDGGSVSACVWRGMINIFIHGLVLLRLNGSVGRW